MDRYTDRRTVSFTHSVIRRLFLPVGLPPDSLSSAAGKSETVTGDGGRQQHGVVEDLRHLPDLPSLLLRLQRRRHRRPQRYWRQRGLVDWLTGGRILTSPIPSCAWERAEVLCGGDDDDGRDKGDDDVENDEDNVDDNDSDDDVDDGDNDENVGEKKLYCCWW